MLSLRALADLFQKYPAPAESNVNEFSLGNRHFHFNSQPAIMGVVNLSRDSWYRESVCLSADRAIERGKILRAQGADIIDVGAESTLAEAARVESSSQFQQLLPVLSALRQEQILVSIETYHPSVAKACFNAGANILNLTGQDPTGDIYRMAADHDAGLIICYVQGQNVREVSDFDFTEDPIAMLYEYFAREAQRATAAGARKIFIDPGLGFYYRNLRDSATRVRHQIRVFLNSFRLRTLGFPVCHALPHAFEYFGEEVRSAEPFFAVLATLGGADLFRTHEVPKIKAVLETLRLCD